jgi:phage gp29-like protein
MPKEMEIEIEKITGSGDGDVHLKMVDWAERSQSKIILGQTLSAEARATGMGSGLADLHNEVRHDILKADARKLAATLTRDLVYPLLALNGKGGDALRRCPCWVFDLGEADDIKTFAESLPTLAANGAKISVAWVHEKLRIPMAEEGEEIFGQQGSGDREQETENPKTEARQAALKASLDPNLDPNPETLADVDRLVKDTAPMVEEWLSTLEAMLESAGSLEEFREMLLNAFPKLGTGPMTEALVTAGTALNLRGRFDVESGDR